MSNQPKHSPGPWFWDDKDALPWTDYDETIHAPFLMDANGSIVMSGDDIRIRNEADGQLMVALPDLLEALNNLMWIIERAGVEGTSTWEPFQSWTFRDDKVSAKEKIDFARAAIAKAEGRGA